MIRVVTWTLGVSPDARQVAAVLGRLRPDLLLLPDQPSWFRLRRCLSTTELRALSRQGRGRSGSVVCGAHDVRLLTAAELPLPGAAEGAGRVASHAIVSVRGRTLSALALRLGAAPEGRREDAVLAADFLARVDHPAVVGADLAEGPGGPAAAALLDGLIDAWTVAGVGTGLTYPAPEPIARHDVVFVDAGLPIGAAAVDEEPPVDVAARHLPVVVDIEEQS